ncbi:MAG TPA: hypothetical protein VNJ07_01375 [Chitinophagales bacterium]|nr:hypothetical protein [Chitinophagales bacterium]
MALPSLSLFAGCIYDTASQIQQQKDIYTMARKYGDANAARSALFNLIVLHPKDSSWLDSLFLFYCDTRSYPQAVMLGNELIKKSPDDTTTRELLAISKQSLGLLKEALDDYEILLKATGKSAYLYQIATIQYNLKRVEECAVSIERLLAMPDIENENVLIQYGQNQNLQQRVPIKAAAYNIKGVLARDIGNKDVAVESFQKALEVFPDFELAKGNLETLRPAESNRQ